MNAPAGQIIEVFLNPGEYYFGDRHTRVRTLLGSCIAVTVWHPQRRVGGMCHFLLPRRVATRQSGLDPRYGVEAVMLLLRDAVAADADPSQCRFKMFGGGNMFHGPRGSDRFEIGARNADAVEQLFAELGLELDVRQVGGSGHRAVIFDINSGDVWLRHQPLVKVVN
jgi:chemotaxis protein CheD